jgi:hypothetical protein
VAILHWYLRLGRGWLELSLTLALSRSWPFGLQLALAAAFALEWVEQAVSAGSWVDRDWGGAGSLSDFVQIQSNEN